MTLREVVECREELMEEEMLAGMFYEAEQESEEEEEVRSQGTMLFIIRGCKVMFEHKWESMLMKRLNHDKTFTLAITSCVYRFKGEHFQFKGFKTIKIGQGKKEGVGTTKGDSALEAKETWAEFGSEEVEVMNTPLYNQEVHLEKGPKGGITCHAKINPMGSEEKRITLNELRTIPFEEGGNDTCVEVIKSDYGNGTEPATWDGDDVDKFGCMEVIGMTWQMCMGLLLMWND